jgi:hypothetical protein
MKTINSNSTVPLVVLSLACPVGSLLGGTVRQKATFKTFLTLAAVLLLDSAFAQSWYTVDDFQYATGTVAYASGLAKDPTGTIMYSVGEAGDASFVRHHLVFQTADGGTNWSASDDYTGSADGIALGSYPAIAADPGGNLYASDGGRANGSSAWFVRSLPAGSSTWVMVDLLLGSGYPSALATDAAGNVYVVGSGQSETWLVRKGTPTSTGMSWANVDVVTNPNGCAASGVFCHPTAGVFVVGQVNGPGVKSGNQTNYPGIWTVRRSQNGGATWATVDSFQLPAQKGKVSSSAYAAAAGSDAAGNLYVVGGASSWIVRKSANPDASSPSWSIVDNFQLAPGYLAGAASFAPDSKGNLFVAGKAANASGWHWVARESVGSAGAWSTVDTFQYGAGVDVYAALGDSLGNVFVAGEGFLDHGWHWLVRKN